MHKTPFQQVLPGRLFQTLARIKNSIWEVETECIPVSALPPTRDHIRFDEIGQDFKPINQYPNVWGMLYDQRWFHIDLQSAKSGDYLFWHDQGEATLYVDGVPAGGFDPGHRFVRLPEKFKTLHIEGTCCRTGIWVTGAQQGISDEGSICKGAFIARRDDTAWEAFHDFEVLLDVASQQFSREGGDANDFKKAGKFRTPLDHVDPTIRRIITGLDLAVDAYDPGHGPELALEAQRRAIFRPAKLLVDQPDRLADMGFVGIAIPDV